MDFPSRWLTGSAQRLTHMKIKLNGDDLKWDVDRVLAVDQVATAAQAKRGCTQWYYSVDFNEKCANVRVRAGVPPAGQGRHTRRI